MIRTYKRNKFQSLKCLQDTPDLNSSEEFWKLLQTLPEECDIPLPIVKFGLLTGHLEPKCKNIVVDFSNEDIESSSVAVVPPKTLAAVKYLLAHHCDHLDKEEKKKVGRLCEVTHLNRANGLGNSESEVREAVSKIPDEGLSFLVQKNTPDQVVPERNISRSLQEKTSHRCPYCGVPHDSKDELEGHILRCDSNGEFNNTEKTAKGPSTADNQQSTSTPESASTGGDQLDTRNNRDSSDDSDDKYNCKHCGEGFDNKVARNVHLGDCEESQNTVKNKTRSAARKSKSKSTSSESQSRSTKTKSSSSSSETQNNASRTKSRSSNSENKSKSVDEYSCKHCKKKFEKKRTRNMHQMKCPKRDSKKSSASKSSYGKQVRKDKGRERKSGKNPFADTDRLKDTGIHQGGN